MSRGPSIETPTRYWLSLKNCSPLGVEQGCVRLDRVQGALAGLEVAPRDLDGASEEVQSHQRRLAALPRDRHLRRARVGLDQLAQVRIQLLVGHPEAAVRVEHLLGEEEAVVAVEVALRACRLREQVERRRSFGHLHSMIALDRYRASPQSVDASASTGQAASARAPRARTGGGLVDTTLRGGPCWPTLTFVRRSVRSTLPCL